MRLKKHLIICLCITILASTNISCKAFSSADTNDVLVDSSHSEIVFDANCAVYHVFWADDVADVRSLAEDDVSVFYISDIGIIQLDKSTLQKKILVKNTKLSSFQLYENTIYYCVDKVVIYSVDLDGNNPQRVIGIEQLNDLIVHEKRIDLFELFGEYIYIKSSGISLIRVHRTTKTAERFIDDANSYAFLGNCCYFVEHAMKTFSIYSKDIVTGDVMLIRGDGITKSNLPQEEHANYEWYDGVLSAGGEMYYTRRLPSEVYMLNPSGEDSRVIDFEHVDSVGFLYATSCRNQVFCTITNIACDAILFEYDTLNCTLTELTVIKGNNTVIPFSVIYGYVFYSVSYNTFTYVRISLNEFR